MPPERIQVQLCPYLSVLKQAAAAPVTEDVTHKTEPGGLTQPSKLAADGVSPQNVDYATDLFGMLSMDGSVENVAGVSGDDDTWAGFQCEFIKLSFIFPQWFSCLLLSPPFWA